MPADLRQALQDARRDKSWGDGSQEAIDRATAAIVAACKP